MVTVLGANSVTGGYDVENSSRFNSGSSDYLNLTAAGNSTLSTKGTWSTWVKKSTTGSSHGPLFSGYADASNRVYMVINADALTVFGKVGGTVRYTVSVDQFFRDPAAWMNIVVAIDTTQGTAANRVKIYINGTVTTNLAADPVYPVQDTAIPYAATSSYTNLVGALYSTSLSQYLDGYLAETVFVDGLALDQDSFGEFDSDSGIWKPIKVSGLTFGDNGFYLEYKGSGTSANASGLGADTSGNTSHFTVNNLTAVDQTVDTCTNNFATFNPLYRNTSTTLSEGNLNLAAGGSGWYSHAATIGVTTGKFYFEVKCVSLGSGSDTAEAMKIGIIHAPLMGVDMEVNQNLGNYYQASGSTGNNGSVTSGTSSARAAYTDGDIIGIAFDMTNRKIYYHKNGTYIDSGDPAAGSNGYVIKSSFVGFLNPVVSVKYNGTVAQANFGNPIVALSSGNTDADGFGNFEYAVPSGFSALCTKNLAEYG